MSKRMNHDQKETAIEWVRARGTLKAGAEAAGVTYQTLRNEIKRSSIFEKRIREAQADGKSEIGDRAVENIKDLASEGNKDVRSRLTANISLANWAVPGFRGESKRAVSVEHNIKVISAIPRPNYKQPVEIKAKKKKNKNLITRTDKDKLYMVNYGNPKLLTQGKQSVSHS